MSAPSAPLLPDGPDKQKHSVLEFLSDGWMSPCTSQIPLSPVLVESWERY